MCVLISLVAIAEEAAAALQNKIEETAAAEFAILKLHLAQINVTSDRSRRSHLEHEPSRTYIGAEHAVSDN